MSEKEKRDIKETVAILKELDRESLLIINSGAQMLKARQDMDKREVATCMQNGK